MNDIKSSRNVLLCCTGSVATIKVPILEEKLRQKGFSVKLIPTNHALSFLKSVALQENSKPNGTEDSTVSIEQEVKFLYPELDIITDTDEWECWKKRGDPIEHIELRDWADIMLIAPLDANTLAKLANGLCDNLLTCIARAWNMEKPLIFCPAMNTQMYIHPLTGKQISALKELGYIEIPVISKTLMCGEKGVGAMAEVDDIVEKVVETLKKS